MNFVVMFIAEFLEKRYSVPFLHKLHYFDFMFNSVAVNLQWVCANVDSDLFSLRKSAKLVILPGAAQLLHTSKQAYIHAVYT